MKKFVSGLLTMLTALPLLLLTACNGVQFFEDVSFKTPEVSVNVQYSCGSFEEFEKEVKDAKNGGFDDYSVDLAGINCYFKPSYFVNHAKFQSIRATNIYVILAYKVDVDAIDALGMFKDAKERETARKNGMLVELTWSRVVDGVPKFGDGVEWDRLKELEDEVYSKNTDYVLFEGKTLINKYYFTADGYSFFLQLPTGLSMGNEDGLSFAQMIKSVEKVEIN